MLGIEIVQQAVDEYLEETPLRCLERKGLPILAVCSAFCTAGFGIGLLFVAVERLAFIAAIGHAGLLFISAVYRLLCCH